MVRTQKKSIKSIFDIIVTFSGILILIGFFLPWAYVKLISGGTENLSGFEFLTGENYIFGFPYRDLPFNFLWFIPIIGIMIIIFSVSLPILTKSSSNRNIKRSELLNFILCILIIIFIFIFIALILNITKPGDMNSFGANYSRPVDPIGYGLILTLTGGLMGIISIFCTSLLTNKKIKWD